MGISLHIYTNPGHLVEGRTNFSTTRSMVRHCESHAKRCSGNGVLGKMEK